MQIEMMKGLGGSKQRVGDHMIPPPTAVGGPTASNRHRTLEEKIRTQNTNTKYRTQSTKKTKYENTTKTDDSSSQLGRRRQELDSNRNRPCMEISGDNLLKIQIASE